MSLAFKCLLLSIYFLSFVCAYNEPNDLYCLESVGPYFNMRPTKCTQENNEILILDTLNVFYNSTNGDYWKSNENWKNDDISYCEWSGINCNDKCEIIGIYMFGNNVSGSLPLQMKNLINLKYSEFYCNFIESGLESLSQIKNLDTISLGMNHLNDLPPSIFKMEKLISLDLSNNKIYCSISEPFQQSLLSLDLSYNKFFGALDFYLPTNLQLLSLSNNNLSGFIPQNINELKKLKYLNLSHNNFQGNIYLLPESITELFLNNNLFSGSIEYILVNMTNLSSFDISYCELTGSLPRLSNKIRWFNLNNNRFSGEIPFGWKFLSTVSSINLSHNEISGGFEHIFQISSLSHLDISYNKFSGSIPTLNFNNMLQLYIQHNNFTGTIYPNTGQILVNMVGNSHAGYKTSPTCVNPITFSVECVPNYNSLTKYGTFLCPALTYLRYNTLVFVDPSYYNYEFCTH